LPGPAPWRGLVGSRLIEGHVGSSSISQGHTVKARTSRIPMMEIDRDDLGSDGGPGDPFSALPDGEPE
jgi:hypothetical protein